MVNRHLLQRACWRALIREKLLLALCLFGITLGVALCIAVDTANRAARKNLAISTQPLPQFTHEIRAVSGAISRARAQALQRQLVPIAAMSIRRQRLDQGEQLLRLDSVALANALGSLGPLLLLDAPIALAAPRSAQRRPQLDNGLKTQAVSAPLHLPDGLFIADLGDTDSIDALWLAWPQNVPLPTLPKDLRLTALDLRQAQSIGMAKSLQVNLQAMGIVALLVGLLLVFNALYFAAQRRLGLFAQLRLIGASGRAITYQLLAEALVLGSLGGLLGAGLGHLLAEQLLAAQLGMIDTLYTAVGSHAPLYWWHSLLPGLILGVLGTQLAALWPAWVSAQTAPARAETSLAESAALSARALNTLALGGLALCAAGLICLNLSDALHAALAALLLMALGYGCATPWVCAQILQRLAGGRLGLVQMIVRNLQRQQMRSAAAVAALTLAAAAGLGLATLTTSFRDSLINWLDASLRADHYVRRANFQTLPEALPTELAAHPMVRAVRPMRNRRLQTDNGPLHLIAHCAVCAVDEGFVWLQQRQDAAQQYAAGHAVLISEALAYRRKLTLADSLSLPTPSGDIALPIAGILRDYSSDRGLAVLSLAGYRRLYQDPQIDNLALALHPGADISQLKRDIDTQQALYWVSVEEIKHISLTIFSRTFAITSVLRVLIVGSAFLAILTSLVAIILARKREFFLLVSAGFSRREIQRLVFGECLLLGLMAGLLALPLGLLMGAIISKSVNWRAFGWQIDLSLPWSATLTTLLLSAMAASIAALIILARIQKNR